MNASGIALTTPRTAYMRKLIKFKNENEPLSENDVSFVPHFEIGGGNGVLGIDNGADVGYPSRPEKDLLTDDAERYRYEIVSEHEAAPTEASLREKSRASSQSASDPTNPLVYVIQPAVELATASENLDRQHTGFEVTKSIGATTQKTEITERIDATVKANHNANQKQNAENEPGAEADDSTSGYKFKTTTSSSRGYSETTSLESSSEHNRTTNGQHGLDHPASVLDYRDPLSSSSVDVITVRHLFGPWSNWTPCSRSCGGGVKMQYRACLKRE